MSRITFRVALGVVSLCLAMAQVGLAAAGKERAPSAAFVHERARERVQKQGEARVIVVMGDPALPQVWARDWRERGPAIQELARRVRSEAPSFRVQREFEIFPFLAGTADARALRELAASANVEAVYPDREHHAVLAESGPLIGRPTVEASGHDGTGIGIAILDTGVDYTHDDLGNSATVNDFPNLKVIGGYDIVNADNRPMDDFGHGTYVAGIAAGEGATYRGIAPAARLVAVKVLDQFGTGYETEIIAGIQWCVTNRATYNIKVINLSLSDDAEWRDPDECDADPEGVAISQATDVGITVVAASGNEGYTQGIGIPACASDAIAVGATWDAGSEVDTPAYFSNRGELLDVYAPGIWITAPRWSGDPEGSGLYMTGAGTSSAAPHVAGAAAILAEMGVTTPAAIAARLARTGVQIVDPVTEVATPRINLVQAVNDEPTSGPDLIVTQVTSAQSSDLVGSSVNLNVTIRNQGDAASAACQAVIGLSANKIASPQDLLMATVEVPALTAGQTSSSLAVVGTVPGTRPDSYYVTAFVDSSFEVTEKNEVNNGLRGSSFSVLVLSSFVQDNIIPASMLKGQTYQLTVTMKNDGSTAWAAADSYALVAVSPQGTNRWGVSQVAMPVSSVASNGTVTFIFNVTAPTEPGQYPCHWQMARSGVTFGEIATGAAKVRVFDESAWGQNYPAVSGNYITYEDYSVVPGYEAAVSVTNMGTGGRVVLPDYIQFARVWDPTWQLDMPPDPFKYFEVSYFWFPDISNSWATWMVDDYPVNQWYFQIVAQDVNALNTYPRRLTYKDSDAWSPAIDGNYVVWEDYRNDPDGTVGYNFLDDNPDIFISDISDVDGPSDYFPPAYPISTAAGPQLAPRISYPYVVWEDWRDTAGFQSDIFVYNLTVDSDGDGIPNWKETTKPSPDPAETRLTDTTWPEEFPDVQSGKVVWMDFRRDSGLGETADIYLATIGTPTPTAVATEPPTFRYHPRVSGSKVTWEDWRLGQPDIYWINLDNGAGGPIAATGSREEWPDISGDRIVYAKHRWTVQYQDDLGIFYDWAVYNIWTQAMPKDGSVAVHTFADVTGSNWAWQYIEAAVANDVVKGYDDGTYQPLWVVNRDQMAAYIARAIAGGDSFFDTYDPGGALSFWDVAADYWAYKYIEYCTDPAQDVVKGYEDGSYHPLEAVNRGQMAAYIGRAIAGGDGFFTSYDPGGSVSFPDVGTEFWAYKYIEYIADAGVTQGYPDGRYYPEVLVTRDQMAVYISRAFGYVD